MKDAEKRENKLAAETNSNFECIKEQEKRIHQLKENLSDEMNILVGKEKELDKVGGLFKQLKEQDESDAAAVLAAQELFQKISQGLLQSDSGENATLEQQVINTQQLVTEAQTEVKQCEMGTLHIKEQLAGKQKELNSTESDYHQDNKNLENKQKELKTLENELKRINYNEGAIEDLQAQKRQLTGEIRKLQEVVDQIESRNPQLRFEYRDPEPGFRRDSVKGLACKLMSLKDKSAAYALDVAGGGRV